MGSHSRIRHVFPGANTPEGFRSLYDQIAPVDATRVFVIKGGPGVGKSTFMRKIAADLLDRGFALEYHHCSADNNSIDAIYIPDARIALLDGTAPHVVDPKNPGAVDTILHLGDFWDEEAIRAPENKAAIIRLNRECSFRFQRAYDCLRAAKAFLEEWKAYYTACLDTAAASARAEELIARVVPHRTGKAGSARRLFASAITYDGPKHFLRELFDEAGARHIVTGPPGTGKSTMVTRLAEAALARGYDLDVYHCPMYPEQVDHLYIRDTDTAVITSAWPHEYAPQPGDAVLDNGELVDQRRLAAYEADIEAARKGFLAAIRREMHHLGVAKKTHDKLEEHYIPYMDFEAIERLRQKTLDRILALAGEQQAAKAE